MESDSELWVELWRYDPNALAVVDLEMRIQVVNPAFYRMFGTSRKDTLGASLESILGDMTEFREAMAENRVIEGVTHKFPRHGITARGVSFPIKGRGLAAMIFHDITNEVKQREELQRIREEAAMKVNGVVADQMRTVQEVAGLLGDALAATRVSLHELVKTIEE